MIFKHTVRARPPTKPAVFTSRRRDKDFQLVITHPSGFAHISSTPDWDVSANHPSGAVVEGGRDVSDRQDAGRECADRARRRSASTLSAEDVPRIFTQHQATTGPDGRFVFERVIPGRGWIGRRIMLDGGRGRHGGDLIVQDRGEFPRRSNGAHRSRGNRSGRWSASCNRRRDSPERFAGISPRFTSGQTRLRRRDEPLLDGHCGPRRTSSASTTCPRASIHLAFGSIRTAPAVWIIIDSRCRQPIRACRRSRSIWEH